MKNKLKNTNLLSYLFMIIGVSILLYQEATTKNQIILITGLVFLIVGIYNLAKKLPSKGKEYQEPLVRIEEDKDEK